MTGLVIDEIERIKKVVNYAVCYYIGLINDEKKDEVLKLIEGIISNHISILLNPIKIDTTLSDLFSNPNSMTILIYLHNQFHSDLPYGNPNFKERLLDQLIKSVCIFDEPTNNDKTINQFQRTHLDAFNNFYTNEKIIIDYVTKFPIILTLIMIAIYADPQRIINHATSLKKNSDRQC